MSRYLELPVVLPEIEEVGGDGVSQQVTDPNLLAQLRKTLASQGSVKTMSRDNSMLRLSNRGSQPSFLNQSRFSSSTRLTINHSQTTSRPRELFTDALIKRALATPSCTQYNTLAAKPPKIPLGKISRKAPGHDTLFDDETFRGLQSPGPASYSPNKNVVMKNLGILAKLV